jgi:hypothetical protein
MTKLAHPSGSGADPQMWLWSAERLFHGGQTLWRLAASNWPVPRRNAHPAEPALHSVALLLFGYAMENALKGLIVQRMARASVRDVHGTLETPLDKHDLRRLANDAGLRLSRRHRDLLLRLETFVGFAGRYPVAKKIGQLRNGDLVPNATFHPVDDEVVIKELFEKLVSKFDTRFLRLSPLPPTV